MVLQSTSMMSLSTVSPGRNIYVLFELSSTDFTNFNLNKSELCHGTLIFLGHVVGKGQVKPMFAKIQAINNFSITSSKKQRMAGYYRKFCNNLSSMSVH